MRCQRCGTRFAFTEPPVFRAECCKDGMHRKTVAGISGNGDAGAFSIVLSGGYEDDDDEGDTL